MISIQHLRKEFPGATPLADVNAEIKKGEVISIIGPSGTGKSTLLRCINLLEKPTSGKIFIDGEEITAKGCKVHLLRRKMGMVFQSFNLYPNMTVIENIMKGPEEILGRSHQDAYDRGMEILDQVGLASRALRFPDELSGGQKQRAAIARTLAMDPEIVLFDEPTSALDPTMVGEVLAVIRNLAKQNLTMLIVTHEMKFAHDVSSRIFYMDEGIIYDEGTPEQIIGHPQKEKTRRFIKQLKVFEEVIRTRDFDFIGINTRIEQFGRTFMMDQKTITGAQTVFEELCVQKMLPCFGNDVDMRITLEYSEKTGHAQMRVYYNGGFDYKASENDLSSLLIQRVAFDTEYTHSLGADYTDCIEIKLK